MAGWMSSTGSRVLLVSPPWQPPYAGSLALGTLRPILEQAGIPTDELHGSPLYPLTLNSMTLGMTGNFIFAPHLYPQIDRPALIEQIIEWYRVSSNKDGALYDDEVATCAHLGINADMLRRETPKLIDKGGICLDRCVERASQPQYDIVGFSCTFEAQLPAALTIARRLKALRPDVFVVIGGAACVEVQGDGLAASFEVLDAVCHTEGEHVIVPLVRALRGDGALADVPGIAWVDDAGTLHHNPSPPLITQMDSLPYPDYGPFMEQYLATEWCEHFKATLYFETSRGCWWGEKHLCTFCGLNAEGLTFRAKSSDRALDEIRALYVDYPEAHYLQATDNILAMTHIRDVLPRLAELPLDPDRALNMFFEVKSNLRRDQIQTMADAGVYDVQPGIESFSDDVLKLMDKGSTGIGQVQFVKWAHECGIGLQYNIIFRNPGEKAEWYRAMTELIPYIEHLPAPMGVTPMNLERFSKYQLDPKRYGIENPRPKPFYAALYPDPGVDLSRIAYVFDYDHPLFEDQELLLAHRAFLARIERWQKAWQRKRSFFLDRGAEGLSIGDRRRSGKEDMALVTGQAAAVYRYLDKARPLGAIRRRFPELENDALDGLLDTWLRRRWIWADPTRFLAVLPCAGRPTAAPGAIQVTREAAA